MRRGPVGWICSACSGEREIIVQGGTSVRSSAFLWKAVEEGSDFSQARAQQEDKGPQWVFQGGCCVSNLKTFKSNWLWAWASWASFELSPVITGLQWNKIFFLQCLKMICNIFQCHVALFEWKPLQITGFYLDLTLNSLWHLIAKECCCCCSTCTPKCWKYGGICSFSAWFKNCY